MHVHSHRKKCRLTLEASHKQGGHFWQQVLIVQGASCRQDRRQMSSMDQHDLQDLLQDAATQEAVFLTLMLPQTRIVQRTVRLACTSL